MKVFLSTRKLREFYFANWNPLSAYLYTDEEHSRVTIFGWQANIHSAHEVDLNGSILSARTVEAI